MKKIIILLMLCFAANSYGQLAMRTDKKDILEKFKSTETIFVLSNVYDTKTYDEILKETWKVTPYRIVKIEDFNPMEYMEGEHSFAILEGVNIYKSSGSYFHTYMTFFMFNKDKKIKEIEKFKKSSAKKKEGYNLMKENRIVIADFLLFKNVELYLKNDIYNDDIFHNYKPGFLKNYFQKINTLITEGTPYGLFGGACTPEIKNLKKATLYVPDYVGIQYKSVSMKETERKEEEKQKLFKKYKYKYEYINTDELNKKIMAGEHIYYLRYVMENAQKYLHIVNAKTGEVIYKNYHPMSYNLNDDNIEEIRKAIEKGKV